MQASGPTDETRQAWLGSLVCWLFVLLAAVLYSTVVLSPKLLAFAQIQNEYDTNQGRLVELDRQLQRMDKIAEALENDPEFSVAMARVDFEKERPGEQRISVGSHLVLETRPTSAKVNTVDQPLPWYTPVLQLLTENRRLSNSLTGMASILILLSFLLAPAEGPAADLEPRSSALGGMLRQQFRERYRLREPREHTYTPRGPQ